MCFNSSQNHLMRFLGSTKRKKKETLQNVIGELVIAWNTTYTGISNVP